MESAVKIIHVQIFSSYTYSSCNFDKKEILAVINIKMLTARMLNEVS